MKRVQNSRVWMGGGVVTAILIAAVGWFMFIGPELSSTTTLHDQANATLQQNSLLQQKVKTLQAKSSRLPRYVASLRSAFLALPIDGGLPAFTRQLSAQAHANGVSVTSVVVGAVSPLVPASAPVPTPTVSASANVPGAVTAAPAGLLSLQVTVLSQGELSHQLAFLNDVRTAGSRRVLVIATQVAPVPGAKKASIAGAASFNTQLTIFSAPQTPEQIAQLKKLLSGDVGN